MKATFNKEPLKYVKTLNRDIAVFSTEGENIDNKVVKSFGDEWLKFHDFSDEIIHNIAQEYFDLLDENIVNKNT